LKKTIATKNGKHGMNLLKVRLDQGVE
jgi:hypothetical protein